MNDIEKMVRQFAEAFYQPTPDQAAVPKPEVVQLRKLLIAEEYCELQDALENGDLAAVAQECCDLVYVVVGTMVNYGLNFGGSFGEVHDANMRKKIAGTSWHDDGLKVGKPPGWQKPDLVEVNGL